MAMMNQILSAMLLTLPSVIMWLECVVRHDAIRACLTFHAFLAMALAAHGPLLRRHDGATLQALFAAFTMFAVGILVYLACRSSSQPGEYLGVPLQVLRATLETFGVSRPAPMLLFAAYFACANPVLEELFWRRLLRDRLASTYTFPTSLCASAYAAYHSVIIAMLMPVSFNLGCAFPFLAFFGHFLSFVADRKGLATSVGIHAGLDLAAAFWVLDLKFGWLDFVF